jgi:large subunit ribosomal protein L3
MNLQPGIFGRKLGSTQLFEPDGTVTRVTVIEAGPVVVVGKRTVEKNGYVALVLGLEERHERHTTKPLAGFFKKANVTPKRVVKELRCSAEFAGKWEVGQTLKLDEIFQPGMFVDARGATRGRGFTGVMRRWNFAGAGSDTHGTHEYRRHGGSIGTNMTPGRTFLNLKMPGQYGNERTTTLNLVVAKVLDEEQIILIEGGVPGSKDGVVTIRGAVKTKLKKA